MLPPRSDESDCGMKAPYRSVWLIPEKETHLDPFDSMNIEAEIDEHADSAAWLQK